MIRRIDFPKGLYKKPALHLWAVPFVFFLILCKICNKSREDGDKWENDFYNNRVITQSVMTGRRAFCWQEVLLVKESVLQAGFLLCGALYPVGTSDNKFKDKQVLFEIALRCPIPRF
jgi:hypothetical protein